MVVKAPPAYTVPPLTARAETVLLAMGFHAVASPVVASSAARRFRVCPPMVVNCPPAYTVPPLTARTETVLFAFGSQAPSVLSDRMCARSFLDTPPTAVNAPPIYHPPAPSVAIE